MVGPKCPIDVDLSWDLVAAEATAHDFRHFNTYQTIHWALVRCMEAYAFFIFLLSFIHILTVVRLYAVVESI